MSAHHAKNAEGGALCGSKSKPSEEPTTCKRCLRTLERLARPPKPPKKIHIAGRCPLNGSPAVPLAKAVQRHPILKWTWIPKLCPSCRNAAAPAFNLAVQQAKASEEAA